MGFCNRTKAEDRLPGGTQYLGMKKKSWYSSFKSYGAWNLNWLPKKQYYCFLMGSIIEIQEKWLRNLAPHLICFQCDEEFQSLITCSWTAKNAGFTQWPLNPKRRSRFETQIFSIQYHMLMNSSHSLFYKRA